MKSTSEFWCVGTISGDSRDRSPRARRRVAGDPAAPVGQQRLQVARQLRGVEFRQLVKLLKLCYLLFNGNPAFSMHVSKSKRSRAVPTIRTVPSGLATASK